MEREHLHLLINEEIYLLSQDEIEQVSQIQEAETVSIDESSSADAETQQVAEPQQEQVTDTRPTTEPETLASEQEVEEEAPREETETESPEIPVVEVATPSEIPLAVFHSSTDSNEIELLKKIIGACKVPADQHRIFGNGFDQSVKFKKALVFVPEAKAFYTPIPYKGSHFLCSRPLSHLITDQSEKAKLWGALQKFVL